MNQTTRKLLLDITHCEDVNTCLNPSTVMHPCLKVVRVQVREGRENYQVPEPWSGDLENAPLLFVSSNPSIGCDVYPKDKWKDDCIVDFFHNRFLVSKPTCCATTRDHDKSWSKENGNGYVTSNLCQCGIYKNVSYWSSIRARAVELMERDVVPGKDYAITEVVHCKSKREKDAENAQANCMEKYFSKILSCSNAKVIIVVGEIAQKAMKKAFKILPSGGEFERSMLCGFERLVLAIPHPNARGGSKKLSVLSDYNKIKQEVKEELSRQFYAN